MSQSSLWGISRSNNQVVKIVRRGSTHGPLILTNVHESLDYVEVSLTLSANVSEKIGTPVKTELIQIVIRPPEFPTEGTNSNISIFFGQNFLTKEASKESRLVSCKHTTEHPLISIALRVTNCFFSELIPRTFQQRTFHSLFCGIFPV